MYIHCTNIINTPEKFILIESLCAYILLEWIFYAQVSMLLIIFNVIQCVCSLTSKYVSTTKIISFSIAWKLRRILFWFLASSFTRFWSASETCKTRSSLSMQKKPFPDKIIFLHWNKFVSVMLYDMLSLYANVKLYGNESKNISDFHVCSGQPKTTSDSKQFWFSDIFRIGSAFVAHSRSHN